MSDNKFSWLAAARLTTNNLTEDEADELDTLIFRKYCDLPFGENEQKRLDELRAKTEKTS